MKLNFDRLKTEFEQNPVGVIAVIGMAASGIAKLFMAGVSAKNARTWDREVKRRTKMSQR